MNLRKYIVRVYFVIKVFGSINVFNLALKLEIFFQRSDLNSIVIIEDVTKTKSRDFSLLSALLKK